jgi:hypothetical protein
VLVLQSDTDARSSVQAQFFRQESDPDLVKHREALKKV